MDRIYKNALNNNKKVTDEELRKLMYGCFAKIFRFLGKENFLRWIKKRDLATRIEQMAIELFDENDEKNFPHWTGFYTEGTDRIKLRKEYANENISIHEDYHFITDHKKRFNIFINEGLTEYMNVLTNEADQYTYRKNVDFVRFLHNMMGDSIIKAYLVGIDDEFNELFGSYISDDGNPNSKELQDFLHLLGKVHEFEHSKQSRKKDKTPDEENQYAEEKKDVINNIYPQIRAKIKNIIVNSLRKKAQNLEFYKDGKLDFKLIYSSIQNAVRDSTVCIKNFMEGTDDKYSAEFYAEICNSSLEAILNETHLSYSDLDGKENISGFIRKCGFETYLDDEKNSRVLYLKNAENLREFVEGGQDIPLILAKIKAQEFYGKEFDLSKFLLDFSYIFSKFDISEIQKDDLYKSVLFDILPKNTDKEVIKGVLEKYEPLYSKMAERRHQNELEVSQSKFMVVGHNLFLEKRDERYCLWVYDEKARQLQEEHISPIELQRLKDQTNILEHIYRPRPPAPTKAIRMSFDDDFTIGHIGNKEKRSIDGIEGLAEYIIIDETIRSFKNKDRYITILNDEEEPIEFQTQGIGYTGMMPNNNGKMVFIEIDKRSRVIDYELLCSDISKTLEILPSNLRREAVTQIVYDTIGSAYSALEVADEEKKLIVRKVIDILKTADINTRTQILEDLNKKSLEFSSQRKDVIEFAQQNGYGALIFGDPKAMEEYKKNNQKREIRRSKAEKRKQVKMYVAEFLIEADEYATDSIEPDTLTKHAKDYGLKGVRLKTTEGFQTATTSKVNYEEFIKKMRIFLQDKPEEIKKDIFQETLGTLIDSWYGSYNSYRR